MQQPLIKRARWLISCTFQCGEEVESLEQERLRFSWGVIQGKLILTEEGVNIFNFHSLMTLFLSALCEQGITLKLTCTA